MASASILAVDLGGTSIRVARVSLDGEVTERREEPTTGGPEVLLALCRAAGDAQRAVVGVPGRVDYGGGRLERAPNLPDEWNALLTEAALSAELGVEVGLANDADLAAVGEAWFGAGRHHADVVYVTLSTGVGAGVVTGGLLVHGRRSLAEIGHSVIDRRTHETVEQLGSGTALVRLGQADGEEVVERALAGDAAAREALDEVVAAAALGCVNLAHLFSPEVIVVGGGLGLNGDLVLDPIRRLVAELGPQDLPAPIGVVNATLGDDAALAGAGAWHRAFRPEAASR